MTYINCAEATLTPYAPTSEKPWDYRRAIHLYRRISFGAKPETIQQSLTQDPTEVVRDIVDKAANLPLTPAPYWSDWTLNDYDQDTPGKLNEQVVSQVVEWSTQWSVDMINNGLRDRMSWFWHNHFVTKLDDYGCPSWMYRYHKVLQKYALGNFKEFVYEIGITPAMLIFLNNIQNTRFEQNENYARELYELFTLGADNGYTQADIEETARAITGWSGLDADNYCGDVRFTNYYWDPGEKTIFGQTGNWNYDDVIDILFIERAQELSTFICRKLYTHFVNPVADDQIIEDLAQTFRNSNFELRPVLLQLFASEHFFDEANLGTIIPGHIELGLTFINEMGYEPDRNLLQYVIYSADDFDQRIFNPTDVSGWPGNRNWITSSALFYRWEIVESIVGYFYQYDESSVEVLRKFTLSFIDEEDVNDVVKVTQEIIHYLLPNGFQHEQEYDEAIAVFKAEVPENYFTNGSWNLYWEYAPIQIFFLIKHLSTQPEYQLK